MVLLSPFSLMSVTMFKYLYVGFAFYGVMLCLKKMIMNRGA